MSSTDKTEPEKSLRKLAEELIAAYRKDPTATSSVELAKAAAELLAAERKCESNTEVFEKIEQMLPDLFKQAADLGAQQRAWIREEREHEEKKREEEQARARSAAQQPPPALDPAERKRFFEKSFEQTAAMAVALTLYEQAVSYDRIAALGFEPPRRGWGEDGGASGASLPPMLPEEQRAELSARAMELRQQAADLLAAADIDPEQLRGNRQTMAMMLGAS